MVNQRLQLFVPGASKFTKSASFPSAFRATRFRLPVSGPLGLGRAISSQGLARRNGPADVRGRLGGTTCLTLLVQYGLICFMCALSCQGPQYLLLVRDSPCLKKTCVSSVRQVVPPETGARNADASCRSSPDDPLTERSVAELSICINLQSFV